MTYKNVGETDRALRIFFGFAIVFVGIIAKSWLTILGIGLAVTGMLGYSILYAVLNVSTMRGKMVTKKAKKQQPKKNKRKTR